MNRDEWTALARGTAAVIAGFTPFVIAGLCASWWLAGGLFALGVGAAVLDAARLPARWRPW